MVFELIISRANSPFEGGRGDVFNEQYDLNIPLTPFKGGIRQC
jgi:hypothetical protein